MASRNDLDQVEALSPEREALWARVERVSFLTLNEKRQAVGYAPVEEPALPSAPEKDETVVLRKYRSDQARAPRGQSDGGQWVDEGGGGGSGGGSSDSRSLSDANSDDADFWKPGARVAQAGRRRSTGSTVPVRIRGREEQIAEPFAREVEEVSSRRDRVLERVRELDPEWRPLPSARSADPPTDIQALIRGLRMEAQEAEARIMVIERGGVPHGFASREAFQDFGRRAWARLSASRHNDAEPFIEGSAVTGHKYETGKVFDVGRRSDFDLAIVSPTLLRRATEIGVRLRGGGSRTEPLRREQLQALDLMEFTRELRASSKRKIGVMIYGSRRDLERRPHIPLP